MGAALLHNLDRVGIPLDVAPDGRFLMLKRAGAPSQMVVVHQWTKVMRARLAGGP